MTTQSIKAKVGNNQMTRNFEKTATDASFMVQNSLVDSNSSTQLGILIPGVSINQVQMTYAGGLCSWRIQNSQTLRVSRFGFASKAGYVCPSETKIAPYTINPSDQLQCFPNIVNATGGDTNVQAWLVSSGGTESFSVTTTADSTLTAMLNSQTSQTLGDWCFGKALTRIMIQCEDGAFLSEVAVFDQTGSQVWSAYGGQRLPTAGGKSTMTNLDVPCNLMIGKGWGIQVSTVTA